MWIDEMGTCHTVALPDPTKLMSDAFRRSLDQLLERSQEEVVEAIHVEEMSFYENQAPLFVWDSEEAEFVGVSPPVALMAEPLRNVADLRRVKREIDDRWRLDALAALDEYHS